VVDVVDRVGVLGQVDQLLQVGGIVLLHLGGDVEGGDADELQLLRLDVPQGQDGVE
jgi:hypothetical protein